MNRKITNKINWILDNLVPPLFRDMRWFMFCLMFLLFGRKTKYFLDFKESLKFNDEQKILENYQLLRDAIVYNFDNDYLIVEEMSKEIGD